MKAIRVEMLVPDDADGEHFITQILPKLKDEHNLKQVHFYKCDYFEK